MDLRRKGNQCPLGSGSSNAHSTAAARNSRYSLYMWRTRACATKCTQLALRTRHASLQAAPSITVPLSSATSHPCFSSKPSAARAFSVSRKAFGPSCTTLRIKTAGSCQRSNNQSRNFQRYQFQQKQLQHWQGEMPRINRILRAPRHSPFLLFAPHLR